MNSVKLAEGLEKLEKKGVAIDSLLVIRNGVIVLDAYFAPYDGSFPHDLASVTKSFTTTLIGIAIDQGIIDPDRTVVSYFPGRTIANLDARKAQLNVWHLASMANGMESGCMSDDGGTLDRMRANPDWVQASLDRKMVSAPGKKHCYDSPGMHILSAILQDTTGHDRVRLRPCQPVRAVGHRGILLGDGSAGLHQRLGRPAPEAARCRQAGLALAAARQLGWQQVVSADWVDASINAHSVTWGDDYGYGWWLIPGGYAAAGRGGQSVRVFPATNTIIVTTAHGIDYSQVDAVVSPALVDSDKPLPANPAGAAQLDAVVARLQQETGAAAARLSPATASRVSGKTFVFAPNDVGIEQVKVDFSDPDVAVMDLVLGGQSMTWPMGMDGRFRPNPLGAGLRAYWEDEQTMVMEIFDIGTQVRRLHFVRRQG